MSILITNGITLIQDKKLLKPKLCTDLIKHIENSEIENVRDQNVQCKQIVLSHTDKLHDKVLDLFLSINSIKVSNFVVFFKFSIFSIFFLIIFSRIFSAILDFY